ncbi:WD40-repeat-containing domain protein [Xylariales sp. AK1849]|nr:WD40-repeat-containing domain protein [Xylariales sp. AK1849]
MRQGAPPTSPAARPVGPFDEDQHHHHHHQRKQAFFSHSSSSSDSTISLSGDTFMPHYDIQPRSESSISNPMAAAGDETSFDHDMTDVEDGGASLADSQYGAFAHDDHIISPFTGGVTNDPPPIADYQDELDDDSSISDFDPDEAFPGPNEAIIPPLMSLAEQQAMQQQAQATHQQNQAILQQQQQQFFQQLIAQQQLLAPFNVVDDEPGDDPAELHPVALSNNPNPMSLGPDNQGLTEFLRLWARQAHSSVFDGQSRPRIDHINALGRRTSVTRVKYGQLKGDKCDLQGINWEDIGVSRTDARKRRRSTYNNYVNKNGSDKWHPGLPDRDPQNCENYFRFRSLDLRRDPRLLHFQLRNILGCASRTRAYYPSPGSVRELDPTTGRMKKAMNFASEGDVQISTLAATEDVLVVGGFLGDYRFRDLNSEDNNYSEGKLTNHVSGITNHVQIHPARRSSAPIAAFASNDSYFRTVDLATKRILSEKEYKFALNCSAISTDQRLRVMVGDHTNVLITDAETGDILQNLEGHRDFGFACDWAPDGWTVATGFQDKSVRIWDARMLTSSHTGRGCPTAVLRMDMSGARSLRFSPLGSGKRVLVAAEEADIINIIDAQTFRTMQKIEVFGEIGGTAFADEGQNLMALVCDRARGGVLHFERSDAGAEDTFEYLNRDADSQPPRPWWQSSGYDWSENPAEVLERPESKESFTRRRRRAAAMSCLDTF